MKIKLLLICMTLVLSSTLFGQTNDELLKENKKLTEERNEYKRLYLSLILHEDYINGVKEKLEEASEIAKNKTNAELKQVNRWVEMFKDADLEFELEMLRAVLNMDKERWLYLLNEGFISPNDYLYLIRASEELSL